MASDDIVSMYTQINYNLFSPNPYAQDYENVGQLLLFHLIHILSRVVLVYVKSHALDLASQNSILRLRAFENLSIYFTRRYRNS